MLWVALIKLQEKYLLVANLKMTSKETLLTWKGIVLPDSAIARKVQDLSERVQNIGILTVQLDAKFDNPTNIII